MNTIVEAAKADHRYQEFLRDQENYGDQQEGYYRGYHWSARRNTMNCWCGYVDLPDNLDSETMDKLESIAYGGITGGNAEGGTGFDTCHINDYLPPTKEIFDHQIEIMLLTQPCEKTYKDFIFVRQVINHMIDELPSKSDT